MLHATWIVFPDFGRVASIFLEREDVLDATHEIFDDMRALAHAGFAVSSIIMLTKQDFDY